MTSKTKTILTALFAVTLLATAISGCNKPDDNTVEDWASSLAGVYVHDELVGGTSYHDVTTVTVTRKDNKAIVIKVDNPGAGSFIPAIHSCFDSITLSNSTTFTINESDNCDTSDYWAVTGSGSFTPNSLTIDWTSVRDAPVPYNSYHYNYTASK